MMGWLAGILVNTIVLMVIAGYFQGFYLSGIGAAVIASIILSVLNIIVRPILILLTLPVTILTLGLFMFVINAITLMLAAGLMGNAFQIDGFGMALLAAVLIAILNALIQTFVIKPLQEKR
ncbi:phage holin family protein [Halalkalibacterium halodurans]|nr:phage holin family protein [Halalkalibacterium halodurans]MDY7224068.1 phage holin family protein [Halalkalibacterium halodurans]MDY7243353.1 phage holin family protein [Halalkalibacterium halodurans]MED3647552.1 phage holin family protein [Halalkalibacterium halodurans]MED4081903.1 phage holin family protein [Halalkalibacterium halodurans]MED4083716.1 phage holin family protein [Halalkalibacterium halodurans]